VLVFWVIVLCGLAGRYQHFGDTNILEKHNCLHLKLYFSKTLISTYKSTQHYNSKTKNNFYTSVREHHLSAWYVFLAAGVFVFIYNSWALWDYKQGWSNQQWGQHWTNCTSRSGLCKIRYFNILFSQWHVVNVQSIGKKVNSGPQGKHM
jgi:hypothetical protein